MFKTNNKAILILAFTLVLVVILFGLIYFVCLTKSIKGFQPSIISSNWIGGPKLSNEQVGDGKIIKTESLTWDDGKYQIIHQCQGEVKQADKNERPGLFPESPKYCLGINKLLLKDPQGYYTLLQEDDVIQDYHAPFLIDIEQFNNFSEEQLLVIVSYAAVECATGDPDDPNCGVGLPNNYFTLVVNLADTDYRKIHYFPDSGEAIWNSIGSKAVVLPRTCGGAGCSAEHLLGYNLEYDQVYTLTEQRASETFDPTIAPLSEKYYSDITGQFIAYWDNVRWLDNDTAAADIHNPDNSVETIKVKF